MSQAEPNTFDHLPRTPAGHFVLHVYAAVFRLIHQNHRLCEANGTTLDEIFARFPFLAGYFVEMRDAMPDDLTWEEATMWWQQQITAWEEGFAEHLPLRAMAEETGLPFSSRLAFVLVGLVEEDSRFGTLFHEMQQPLPDRRPNLELVGRTLLDDTAVEGADPWTLCRPLLIQGFLEVLDRTLPRSEWQLRVPPLLWDAARGEASEQPAPWCRVCAPELAPELDGLIYPPELLDQLERLPELLRAGTARTVVLRAAPGALPEELLAAVARRLGRGMLCVDGAEAAAADAPLGPLATLTRTLPVVRFDLGPGETIRPLAFAGYRGPLGLVLGLEGGIAAPERAVTFTLPTPDAGLRAEHWRRALDGRELEDFSTVVEDFQVNAGHIHELAERAVAQAGLEGREALCPADVRRASRSLNRQFLDTLASPLKAQGSWDLLITGATTGEKLHELERRCRHRERLLGHLGAAFGTGGGGGRGVRALFTGTSGTGKTLAARLLAAELGMDLYRVDLAAVVDKYIGETEKNLHRVLSWAEALDVLLLLDEGDALLGRRTEVKSSNDRYANLETNYLLQRLETYQGIVVVTTNLGENIDPGFKRRIDVVVPFFPPQAEERRRILALHLPPSHALERDFLDQVAIRCALTGGQLRNVAQLATLLALDEHSMVQHADKECIAEESLTVHRSHLERALRSEYRKAGATFPLEPRTPRQEEGEGSLEAFASALGVAQVA